MDKLETGSLFQGKIREMFRAEAKLAIAQELSNAQLARQAGNEGRARVCSRRAAGMAVREYFELRHISAAGASAYDLLMVFQELPEATDRSRQAAQRLTNRVNEDFHVPGEPDLIEEARWLAQALEEQLGDDP